MDMVGMMAVAVAGGGGGGGGLREQAVMLLNDAKLQSDISAKTDMLKRLKEIILYRDPSLLHEFVPHLMEFQTDRSSPIRKSLSELIEEIGMKHLEHIPSLVPVLLTLLHDDTPAVARSAISSGTKLFRNTLEQVAIQGIRSGCVEKWLEESWLWVIRLKDAIYPIAYQHGNDGVRFHAMKFVETAILMFTSDPSVSSEPPALHQNVDAPGFDVAWIVGGHPVLDASALGQEVSRILGLLLDQLRPPEVSKLPGPVAIVLVNSLSSIAKKRSSLYGRVLPVLLALGPNCDVIKGGQVASVVHALKNAFLSLLKSTDPVAVPWRERLVSALRTMNAGDVAEAAVRQVERMIRNAEKDRASHDSRLIKDDKMHGVEGVRKRSTQENGNEPVDLDDSTSKRLRVNLSAAHPIVNTLQDHGPTGNDCMAGSELSPLQQMIAMIGALVEKGERAAPSIELLLASLPPDMLADIVIENMKNLPTASPPLPSSTGVTDESNGVTVTAAPQLNIACPIVSTAPSELLVISTVQETIPVHASSDHRRDLRSRDPRRVDPRKTAVPVGASQSQAPVKADEHSAEASLMASAAVRTDSHIVLNRELAESEQDNYIPGINDLSPVQENVEQAEEPLISDIVQSVVTMLETVTVESTDITMSSQLTTAIASSLPGLSSPLLVTTDQSVASTGGREPIEPSSLLPVVSAKSEPVLPMAVTVPLLPRDAHGYFSGMGSVAAPGAVSHVIPSAVLSVYLTEEKQATLSKAALMRILEDHKLISAAGADELRIALLARLIAQFYGDEEILGILQKHIFSDYQNHKGHDVAIHMLYQLYSEQMPDVSCSGASTVTSTVYDKFFLSMVECLRDNFPPSDKSLSRLLGEAPILPGATLKLLEALCNPVASTKEGIDRSMSDRVTQGLSAVWSLILFRPPVRASCLNIALQCAVHELEEVRTKAIRLVANKLYPLDYASQVVEEFATRMLQSVVETKPNLDGTRDGIDSDEASIQEQGGEKELERQRTLVGDSISADSSVSGVSSIPGEDQRQGRTSVSGALAMRCMSLYFALCVKKNSLLRHLFNVFGHAPKGVRQAVKWQMPTLIRTIGPLSPELLQIISDPLPGSKNLVLQVLHILTESSVPPPELIIAVKQLYDKSKDAMVLIPVLSSLSKDEVLPIFPHLVELSPENFKAALARILQGSVNTGPALTPAEVLIAIHGIDPERDAVPLAKVKDACSICFQQRTVFTQQVLARVLNQLVEQTPLPMLFMRTVIQAVGAFHSLVNFVMEILSRLVSKQIWKSPTLWVGFLKCADQTQPHSFHVLLQLPAVQLEKALHKHPNLRPPLTAHSSQPNVRSTLPRSTLVVLGLAQDSQPADPSIPNQSMSDGNSVVPVSDTQVAESV